MHQIQQKSKEEENIREVKRFFQNLENSMSKSFILAFKAVLKKPAVVAYTSNQETMVIEQPGQLVNSWSLQRETLL